MKSGRGLPHRVPLRLRLLLLIAGPLIVALFVGLGLGQRFLGTAQRVDTAERGAQIEAAFIDLLEQAGQIADAALDTSPQELFDRPGPGRMAGRLEGVGQLDAKLLFSSWAGTPAEPGPLPDSSDPQRWIVRLDGIYTRLVVHAGPDVDGDRALASFILDGRVAAASFDRLLPPDLLRGIGLDLQFLDSEAASGRQTTAELFSAPRQTSGPVDSNTRIELRSPTGDLLGSATIHPVPAERLQQQRLRAGRAWATVLFPVLLLMLFDWKSLTSRWRGFAGAIAAIVICRAALLSSRAAAVLLPRELGTATAFGSTEGGGLLASPADLLLTCLALLLVALAARRLCRAMATERRPVVLAALLGGGTLLAAISLWLGLVVVRNATVPALQEPSLTGFNAPSLLVLGLAFVMLGAALLWGTGWTLWRSRPAELHQRFPLIPIAVAAIVVAAVCSIAAQLLHDRLALERLASETAPQVLEQSARRSVALSAAVRRIEQAYRDPDSVGPPASSQQAFLAYHFWVTGDLLLSGYKSSLDFYTPNGTPISHFGFGLPAFYEEIRPSTDAPGELFVTEEETFDPATPVQQNLIHAEMTVLREEQVLGVVVGHVLDEFDNLPFLPSSQPYLAALGPGAPHGADDPLSHDLQYVLYDRRGTVMVSSMVRPPRYSDEMRRSAASGDRVRARAGEHGYFGLALEDDGLLHLLLLPERDTFEHAASATRLALFPCLVAAFAILVRLLFPPYGPALLLRRLTESFRRKLLAALLVASILPLVGLALFLQAYVEKRGRVTLVESATHFVAGAKRQLEAYAAYSPMEATAGLARIDDWVVHWLRDVVGQEIHVYENGLLRASSKRELFDSGLLPLRIDGAVQRRLTFGGRPSIVVPTRIGPNEIPVAYAPVRGTDSAQELIVAVPIVVEQRQIERATKELVERILLSTVLLVSMLSIAAAYVARTVARPVRELVGATARIAAGDYAARLEPRTRDEIAELVQGFNSMAGSLAAQRADLERRRDYMERLLRHATTGVISTDAEGLVVTLNPAAVELLGSAGARPRIGSDLVQSLARGPALAPLAARLREAPEQVGEPEDVDLELDGEPHRFRLMRVDLPDPSGGSLGRLILLDDVTELMRSNQLAAWAEMARAIAHEIKNPLTPIQLSTEHLRRLLRDRGMLPDETVEACLETVMKQVRTLYQIAGEFSAYAKLPALAPEPVDPAAFMRATLAPYTSASPAGITIEERYEPAGGVAIDAKVLSRAVVNLVENALHAMPDGGTLTLGVRSDSERGEVVLSVKDTGSGLDPDVRRHLFDPYFSTKSSGTGLGLAIARRAVEAHQGTIEVRSELGSGTEFLIRLPLLDADILRSHDQETGE